MYRYAGYGSDTTKRPTLPSSTGATLLKLSYRLELFTNDKLAKLIVEDQGRHAL